MPPNWLLPLTSSPVARAWLSQTSRVLPSATNHTEWLATIAVSLCSLAFPQPPGPAERLGLPPRTHPFIPLTRAGLAVLAARAFPRGPTASTTSDPARGCGWSWPLCAALARATCRFATGSCPSATTGKPQAQLSSGTRWARQRRLGGCGGWHGCVTTSLSFGGVAAETTGCSLPC